MELLIDLKGDSPIYEQIYEFIKNEIKEGKILPDVKLPSTRNLALSLKVSRTTVINAYEQLLAEGYLKSKSGSGYTVNKLDVINIEKKRYTPYLWEEEAIKEGEGIKTDFSPYKIDSKNFPYASWRSIAKKVFSSEKGDVFISGNNQGEYGLRSRIADYLHTARRVVCSPENIVIGAGSEYLIMLLGMLLRKRKIALENPGYLKAREVFKAMFWDIVNIDMDKEGIDICKLRNSKADICYLMPANQYPTGIIIPINRRRELVSWCYEEVDRYIIEDDYDSEFRFVGKPIPAMQGLDPEKIIYMGTFSKSIAPAIRVAYMVLPHTLMQEYKRKLSFLTCTVPRSDQDILEIFIKEGYFERHLNRMRTNYRVKRDVLISSIRTNIPYANIFENNSGLHILLTIIGLSEGEILSCAKAAGVKIYPISDYYSGRKIKKSTVLIGFAGLTVDEIKEGIEDFSNELNIKYSGGFA